MTEHYEKLRDEFNALPSGHEYSRDRSTLTRAMLQTMSGIHALTRDPAFPIHSLPVSRSEKEIEAIPPSPKTPETDP